jgi:hypothetical protein
LPWRMSTAPRRRSRSVSASASASPTAAGANDHGRRGESVPPRAFALPGRRTRGSPGRRAGLRAISRVYELARRRKHDGRRCKEMHAHA